jgi:glycosyltransferase involved in cell wall biosynthesis
VKVLHVITGLDAGGAELQLAMLLRRTRHDSDVVSLYNPGPIADQIRASGTKVTDFGMRSNTQLSALYQLYRYIKKGHYDVVHTHLYRAQVYARPAARLGKTPVVLTTEHSIGETHIERRKMTKGVRRLYLASEAFSDATIAVSDIVVERLVNWGVPAKKITMIPNGVNLDELAFSSEARRQVREQFAIDADAYVIGALGRLDPNKRIDLLMEAVAPQLSNKCVLFIVGRGEEQERLEAEATRLGVTDHVVFAGYQSDTAAMLSAFDLFVTTSRQETFGLSVLEALGSGLPALFTTCPALDGIETDRAHHVEGDVGALRDAIAAQAALGHPERIVPTEVFSLYGMQSVVDQIDDLYERILADRPKRRIRDVARHDSTRTATEPQPHGATAPAQDAHDVAEAGEHLPQPVGD